MSQEYQAFERKILLDTAHSSIKYALVNNKFLIINSSDYSEHLRQIRACFVTLHLNSQLRGCIGTLIAQQALIQDVAQNAYNAAFKDPRFTPVTINEYSELTLDISVLSQPQIMQFSSEQELIRLIRPGVDGLILSDKGRRGTFLPSVWEQLPNPEDFLRHLKNKAGFSVDYWSDTIKIENYTAELIK